MAFNYLKGQGIAPIDYFAVWRGGWNHAFVVLNRDAKIPVPDFAKWKLYHAVGPRSPLRSSRRLLGKPGSVVPAHVLVEGFGCDLSHRVKGAGLRERVET